MNFITRKHIARRTFLRGAGAAVALPWLESMVPAMASEPNLPRRLACVYFPHGATMDKWTPAAAGHDFPMSEILQPLERHRRNLVVLSGLSLPTAYGEDSSAEANHIRSSACFLSGAPPVLGAQARLGTTFDQLVARHLSGEVPLPSLELGIEEPALSCGTNLPCAYRNTLAWQGETSPLPMETNPQAVFERLFGDGSTEEQRRARRTQARSLLDGLLGEISDVRRTLPGSDAVRLEHYLDDVREVERRMQMQDARGTAQVSMEAPSGVPPDFDSHVKLQLELLALAWRADVTRVGTLLLAQETSNATYPASGVSGAFHILSHHSNVRESKDRFAVLNRYHVGIFAHFLDVLAKVPEGDGTLLDQAMALYGSGMSNGNEHDHGPLPIVLAGGAGGSIAGNRHLQVAEGTPLSNLQLAMLNKLGVPVESFADSTGAVEI